jgi:hypothetical protein
MADPTVRLAMLLSVHLHDPMDRKTLAVAIERYRSARRHGKSETFRNIIEAVECIDNPQPLITDGPALLVDDAWKDLLPAEVAE